MKKIYRIFILCFFLTLFYEGSFHSHYTAAAAYKKAARPNLTVSLKEVSLEQAALGRDANGRMVYSAYIRNHSSEGTVKKIEYIYSALVRNPTLPTVETGDITGACTQTTVTLTATHIRPGKISKQVQCAGDESGQLSAMKLQKIRLYAGTALYTYNVASGKGKTGWGSKDKKPPVISGWVGKNSYNGKDAYLVCYSDWKNKFDFTKYVSATDNRDGTVKVKADTDDIDWEKDGVYKVTYTATDKAGNEASAWAKVQVFVSGTAEQIADSVLKSVTKKNWSDEKKARAIYKYVRGHCTYVGTGSHSDWEAAAIRGLRYQSGDCFTYYSMARLLLTRAGIPNIMITRYPSHKGYHHWWSLVHAKNGWYHFDTTPRKRNAMFCLLTDAQMWKYSSGSTFRFQTGKYPQRAKKKISKDPQKGA